jgi:C4-dicarboxylate transporter, DctM subunit
VMLGIYTGLFTVTESGAIGALIALAMVVVENDRGGPRRVLGRIYEALLEGASITGMMFAILIGASVLSTFLVMSRVPADLATWIGDLEVARIVILLVIIAAIILLGMALESMSIVVITVPLLYPVVTGLGYDGIWFGIVMVKLIEIGLLTPPVGMNVYVVSGASGVRVEESFRGVLPFVAVDLAIVALLVVFPDIVLWLPGTVTG